MTRGSTPQRWASFAGVGLIGFGVQLAMLALLTAAVGVQTAPAAALAVETAVLHNFAWHERWTWRDRARGGARRILSRLARFHAGVGTVSLAGNVGITVALVEYLHLTVVLANACAAGTLSVLNFYVADRWVFAVPDMRDLGVTNHPAPAGALPRSRRAGTNAACVTNPCSPERPVRRSHRHVQASDAPRKLG